MYFDFIPLVTPEEAFADTSNPELIAFYNENVNYLSDFCKLPHEVLDAIGENQKASEALAGILRQVIGCEYEILRRGLAPKEVLAFKGEYPFEK